MASTRVSATQILPESLTNEQVAAGAAVALSKLATDPLDRANHTGTQSADTLTNGTDNKLFLAADRTKLDGITDGAAANESDAYLRGRANHTGEQAISTVTGLQDALNAKASLSEKDSPAGYAGLDGDGKVDASQLPGAAVTDTFVVSSEEEMLGLTVQVGDVAIRSDLAQSYILKTAGAGTLGHWELLRSPAAAVSSVLGRTGDVTAQPGDYAASQITVTPFTNVTSAQLQSALEEIQAHERVASVVSSFKTLQQTSVVLNGPVDGTNKTFFLPVIPLQPPHIYQNGVRIDPGNDYTVYGQAVIFTVAPEVGDKLRADYFGFDLPDCPPADFLADTQNCDLPVTGVSLKIYGGEYQGVAPFYTTLLATIPIPDIKPYTVTRLPQPSNIHGKRFVLTYTVDGTEYVDNQYTISGSVKVFTHGPLHLTFNTAYSAHAVTDIKVEFYDGATLLSTENLGGVAAGVPLTVFEPTNLATVNIYDTGVSLWHPGNQLPWKLKYTVNGQETATDVTSAYFNVYVVSPEEATNMVYLGGTFDRVGGYNKFSSNGTPDVCFSFFQNVNSAVQKMSLTVSERGGWVWTTWDSSHYPIGLMKVSPYVGQLINSGFTGDIGINNYQQSWFIFAELDLTDVHEGLTWNLAVTYANGQTVNYSVHN